MLCISPIERKANANNCKKKLLYFDSYIEYKYIFNFGDSNYV